MILLGLSVGSSRKVLLLALLAIAVAMLWNAGLGVYHSGVEWQLVAGSAGLLGRDRRISAPAAACSSRCNKTRVVRCDEAAWRFLGLSLAGYNVLISLRSPRRRSALLRRALPRGEKRDQRLQFGVPVEIVEPALVQVVRREQPAVAVQVLHARLERHLRRAHAGLGRRHVALAQIAGRAGRDHVVPGRVPAARARQQVVEGEVVARAADTGRRTGRAGTR